MSVRDTIAAQEQFLSEYMRHVFNQEEFRKAETLASEYFQYMLKRPPRFDVCMPATRVGPEKPRYPTNRR